MIRIARRMHVLAHRSPMLLALAASLAGAGGAVPARAASGAGASVAPEAAGDVADAAPPVLANLTFAAVPVAGVPCFNCANRDEPFTEGIPAPAVSVPRGAARVQLVTFFSSLTYAGPCTASFVATGGGRIVLKGSFTFEHVRSRTEDYIFVDRPRPAYAGPAELVATLACGAAASSVSSHLVFD